MGFKKAQVWSYDLIVSTVVFLLALSVLSFFWWSISTTAYRDETSIITQSLQYSDMLLTPGVPSSWYVNVTNYSTWGNVQQVGLMANTSGTILDSNKTGSFYEMSAYNYSLTKTKSGFKYDYYLYLTAYNGSEQAVGVTGQEFPVKYYYAGLNPSNYNTTSIAKTERIVIYNNEIVRLKLLTWTSEAWD